MLDKTQSLLHSEFSIVASMLRYKNNPPTLPQTPALRKKFPSRQSELGGGIRSYLDEKKNTLIEQDGDECFLEG